MLHSGTMLRKIAYLRAGGYRRDLRMTLDFAMWPVLAFQGDVAYCDAPLYAYRTHAAQMSSSFKKQHANFVEVMKSVKGACDAAVRQGVPIGSLRDDAIRYALFAVALDDAFSGRLGAGTVSVAVGAAARATARFDVVWPLDRPGAARVRRARLSGGARPVQEARGHADLTARA